jgi:hypothetical protein
MVALTFWPWSDGRIIVSERHFLNARGTFAGETIILQFNVIGGLSKLFHKLSIGGLIF